MPNSQQPPLDKKGISYHCFNADKSQVAVCPNSEDFSIYKTNGSEDPTKWEKTQEMSEHGQYISGIDWCQKTNLIVTCSHDRNAYVWKLNDKGVWEPTLVVLRISRAATDVKWSPNGDKFAVTSGAKCVPVCHYVEAENWWISKMIKKHKSTVTCLDWSPNSKLVVTGACDFKCRIFSAFLEELDTPGDDAGYAANWPDHEKFGECLFEFDQSKAWVNSVAWSPDNSKIAFSGHGATLSFVDVASGGKEVSTIYHKDMPYSKIGWVGGSDTLIAVGYDSNPTVYKCKGGTTFELEKKLDPEEDGKTKAGESKVSARSSAFAKFQAADSRGSAFGESKEDKSATHTMHKNHIVDVKINSDGTITTSSYDGRILTWTI